MAFLEGNLATGKENLPAGLAFEPVGPLLELYAEIQLQGYSNRERRETEREAVCVCWGRGLK